MEYTQTELKIMALFSAAGAALSFLIGGFDAPVKALLVLIVVDYATGIFAAGKTGKLNSFQAFRGMGKKIAIVAIVAFANMLDISMALNHTLRSMAIFGFAGMEGMSIIENVDRADYGGYIPQFIRDKLLQLRQEKGLVQPGGVLDQNKGK